MLINSRSYRVKPLYFLVSNFLFFSEDAFSMDSF